MNYKKIGLFLKQRREEKNFTQNELAKKLMVSRQAISGWETGKSLPDYDKVEKICECLDITISEFYSASKNVKSLPEIENTIQHLNKDLKNQRKKLAIVFTTFVIGLLLLFGLYFFLNTYNSVKVYLIYGESKNYKINNGIFILSKEKIYFKLDIDSELNQIKNVTLNKKNNKNINLLFNTDDDNLFLIDYYGYESYFKYEDIIHNKIKLVLEIENENEEKEIIELKLIKDYENRNLIFKKTKKISLDKATFKEINVPPKIKNNFEYKDGNYVKVLKKDNLNVELCYFTDDNLFWIIEHYQDYDIDFRYYNGYYSLDYLMYNKDITLNEIYIDFKNYRNNNEKKIVKYFKENYLDKYIN